MTVTGIERVRSLADVGVEDIALVGNQAATLASLRRAGLACALGRGCYHGSASRRRRPDLGLRC
jgi:hypothetical protein